MGYLSCRSRSSTSTVDPLIPKSKPIHRTAIRTFLYEDLVSATHGFSKDSLLGRGSHGCVYKALLDNGKLIAAVKKPSSNGPRDSTCSSTSYGPDDNEIEILSSIRCSRFVNLLGYTSGVANQQQQQRLLVVEYMANGTLHDNLHSSVDSGGHSSEPPGWIDRVRWAHQIARAVDSLHSMDPPVIHRDIKSSNVLIDRRRDARLGDFGLAVRLTADPFRCTARPAGTLGYIDPAYVTPEDLSVKSDVFSFGILLLEMMSGRKAIDVGYSPPSAVDWAAPIIGRRGFVELCDPRIGPPGDLGVAEMVAELAGRCVEGKAERRPSMAEAVECLRKVRRRASPSRGKNVWGGIVAAAKRRGRVSDVPVEGPRSNS
ncbi:Serine/threonine-protein kinase-like protein [Acorus calamus]|uniref:Serine/threonine-protein kinase-like protein n=1 Tax=Acorus calamus TaxID=4465 RepID=A0AAV9ENG2_ACOCL|nr:Serine/threonine-protein kinase-like protein [Acorus calamus]